MKFPEKKPASWSPLGSTCSPSWSKRGQSSCPLGYEYVLNGIYCMIYYIFSPICSVPLWEEDWVVEPNVLVAWVHLFETYNKSYKRVRDTHSWPYLRNTARREKLNIHREIKQNCPEIQNISQKSETFTKKSKQNWN